MLISALLVYTVYTTIYTVLERYIKNLWDKLAERVKEVFHTKPPDLEERPPPLLIFLIKPRP
jgi:hypothetical protein